MLLEILYLHLQYGKIRLQQILKKWVHVVVIVLMCKRENIISCIEL